MKKRKVYIASPLGFSDAGRYYLKKYLLPSVSKLGLDVLDPWGKVINRNTAEIAKKSKTMSKKVATGIGKKNAEMIRDCDVVLAVLDGSDVDSGVAAEIGYAYGIGKRILGYRGDSRLTGESAKCLVNLQVETFIKESGGKISMSLDDLLKLLGRTR
ncbi:MAG: nucleoside 2-deoxyribosyltransferase [Candidatus Bathyarchaeia archaeon]